jgi:hypothetical protein
MNPFAMLFHIAAKNDPSFLNGDGKDTLLTMAVNRLHWGSVPAPFGDRESFATGYLMARERMGRDPELPEGRNHAYDEGYELGEVVARTGRSPEWDTYQFTEN